MPNFSPKNKEYRQLCIISPLQLMLSSLEIMVLQSNIVNVQRRIAANISEGEQACKDLQEIKNEYQGEYDKISEELKKQLGEADKEEKRKNSAEKEKELNAIDKKVQQHTARLAYLNERISTVQKCIENPQLNDCTARLFKNLESLQASLRLEQQRQALASEPEEGLASPSPSSKPFIFMGKPSF